MELHLNSTVTPMKTHATSIPAPLSYAGSKTIRAIAAAGFLLGGLGTATGRADILYVSNAGNNTIQKFTSDGVGSVFASTGLRAPSGLAFDIGGNLYVANNGNYTIGKCTPGGVGSVFASTDFEAPLGLAFDSAGNLYQSYLGGEILKYTPGGVRSTFATGVYALGLAFDSAGNLYATTSGYNTIEKFSPTGAYLGVFASTDLNFPSGLAFDSAGNLYVSNGGDNTITKFTSGGVGSVFATGLDGPLGLAFDSADNLYVANSIGNGSTIEKFSPTGTNLGTFASASLSYPEFLVFTDDNGVPLPLTNQAPEPTTLSLAAVGSLTLLRRNARRRRN